MTAVNRPTLPCATWHNAGRLLFAGLPSGHGTASRQKELHQSEPLATYSSDRITLLHSTWFPSAGNITYAGWVLQTSTLL